MRKSLCLFLCKHGDAVPDSKFCTKQFYALSSSCVSSSHSFTSGFWTQERVKAFLSQVPDDHMIILDLASLQRPVWSRLDSYFGKPFVWCLLNNFGGMRGVYADLSGITQAPLAALADPRSTMVGIGLTPEAIEHNPVMFDLMVCVCCKGALYGRGQWGHSNFTVFVYLCVTVHLRTLSAANRFSQALGPHNRMC